MEHNSGRIAKNTIILYLRMAFLLFIGLFTSREILRILGVEDYGIYNLIGGIVVIMSFVNGSMGLAVNRFIAFELGRGDIDRCRKVFSMSINIHILLCLVVVALSESVGLWFVNSQLNIPDNRMVAANLVYQMSILSFIFQTIQVPYNASLIANENMKIYAYISIFDGLAKLGIVYIVGITTYDKLWTYSILLFIVLLLDFIINYLYVRIKYLEARYQLLWSGAIFKDMLKYIGFSTYGSLATVVMTEGQSILLNIFYGPALNAVRGIALQVNSAVVRFVQGAYTAVTPQITKSYAAKDYDYMRKLIYNSSLLTFYLFFLFTLPIFLEIDLMLNLWLSEVPAYTSIFVRLVIIHTLISYITMPSQIAIYSTGDVAKLNIYTGTLNIIAIGATYLIWKNVKTEPYVIFIVQIGFTVLVQFINLYLQKIQLGIDVIYFFKKVVVRILYSCTLASIIPLACAFSFQEGIMRFVIVCLAILVFSLPTLYFTGINKNLRQQITKMLKTKIKSIYNKN